MSDGDLAFEVIGAVVVSLAGDFRHDRFLHGVGDQVFQRGLMGGAERREIVVAQMRRFDQVRAQDGVEIDSADALFVLDAFEVCRRGVAADRDVGELGQRRLVDDGVVGPPFDAVLLAPRLGKDVMDVDVVVEDRCMSVRAASLALDSRRRSGIQHVGFLQ